MMSAPRYVASFVDADVRCHDARRASCCYACAIDITRCYGAAPLMSLSRYGYALIFTLFTLLPLTPL